MSFFAMSFFAIIYYKNKTPFNNFFYLLVAYIVLLLYVCYTTNTPTTLIGLHKGNGSEHAVMFMILIHPKMFFFKCESSTLA